MGAGDVVSTFDLWFNAFTKGPKLLIWRMACIALVWTIWRLRNISVFLREVFGKEGCFELVHFDFTWWIKME